MSLFFHLTSCRVPNTIAGFACFQLFLLCYTSKISFKYTKKKGISKLLSCLIHLLTVILLVIPSFYVCSDCKVWLFQYFSKHFGYIRSHYFKSSLDFLFRFTFPNFFNMFIVFYILCLFWTILVLSSSVYSIVFYFWCYVVYTVRKCGCHSSSFICMFSFLFCFLHVSIFRFLFCVCKYLGSLSSGLSRFIIFLHLFHFPLPSIFEFLLFQFSSTIISSRVFGTQTFNNCAVSCCSDSILKIFLLTALHYDEHIFWLTITVNSSLAWRIHNS